MGFAETFKALSDPARREILTLLRAGRLSAGEIGAHFDMTGATISYHLGILKRAELVFETKEKNDGRQVYGRPERVFGQGKRNDRHK